VLVAPLIALMLFYADISSASRSTTVSNVVSTESLHAIQAIETDFERALRSSAQSALLSAVGRVVSEGRALADARTSIQNLVANGSFEPGESVYPSMGQNYLSNWASNMRRLSSAYGLNVTLIVLNVRVTGLTPASLLVTSNLSLFVQSLVEPASFNFTRSYSESVVLSIEALEDPLFSLNTNGVLSRVVAFNASPVSNLSTLETFISEKKYAPNPDAPDFLNRLEGRLSPNVLGFETVVNPNELSAQDLPIRNQSHADHLFFNASLSNQGRRVSSMIHPWLQIDCTHAAFYGVTNQTSGC
ncbi:MAG TPA: hypothetical protein VI874_00450, partial [Candidatus Norongarragalinales archaeon]|nr:hypothetical protein [Candidatus Norongarragalinales archaeon]